MYFLSKKFRFFFSFFSGILFFSCQGSIEEFSTAKVPELIPTIAELFKESSKKINKLLKSTNGNFEIPKLSYVNSWDNETNLKHMQYLLDNSRNRVIVTNRKSEYLAMASFRELFEHSLEQWSFYAIKGFDEPIELPQCRFQLYKPQEDKDSRVKAEYKAFQSLIFEKPRKEVNMNNGFISYRIESKKRSRVLACTKRKYKEILMLDIKVPLEYPWAELISGKYRVTKKIKPLNENITILKLKSLTESKVLYLKRCSDRM